MTELEQYSTRKAKLGCRQVSDKIKAPIANEFAWGAFILSDAFLIYGLITSEKPGYPGFLHTFHIGLIVKILAFADGATRANCCASSAGDALFCINNVLGISLGNSSNRALTLAGSAANTIR